ncbi:hypothetical protein GLOIN_2v1873345 [Rhizophagus clarus]|uniref:Uncharacterized protein n=1 Tax=Rhizophagus clarus TaxID=94130 RepID=A0A8H3QQ21_9GLOM|nr:hypothetical protein GLOIN_2v1873345 [Rhizophagus clarus]
MGKLLLKPVIELSRKPPKDRDDNDLMPIVKLLAGRPYIDGRGENREGAYAITEKNKHTNELTGLCRDGIVEKEIRN